MIHAILPAGVLALVLSLPVLSAPAPAAPAADLLPPRQVAAGAEARPGSVRFVPSPEAGPETPEQQPTSQGRAAPASGSRIDLGGGLSLLSPAGWSLTPANPGATVLVGPDSESLIIVSVDEGLLEAALAELAGPVDLGDGVVLDPIEAPVSRGQLHSNRFTVRGAVSPMMASIMIREVSPGRTVSLIGLAPSAAAAALQSALGDLMTHLTVGRAPAQGASGWGAQLKGRYLVKFYSGNGYSEKHELWLCSNGSFLKRVDGGGFTQGVASGAFAGGLNGTWTAQGSPPGAGQLVLSTSDGQVLRYTLQSRPDGIGIDGERWMRADNERCA